ncbi:MAG: transposase [Aureliella sp.]
MVRSLAFQQVLWREVHYGEYVANCQCCKTFHSHPEDIEPKAKYDNKVRQVVIDRILVDKLNATTTQQALRREFLLELSTGFLYDCLEYAIRKFDGAEFRAKVLSEFSGTLCVDEIHLGHRVVLLASDPIADNPIACALVSSNDAAHMQRFLRNLKNHGFSANTVITDRSPLYPKTIAEVWPEAKHQLCVFHVMAEINNHVLDAVRQVRRAIKPKRIKKGRGRPSKRNRARVKKLKEQRAQADKLFRRRHLIVTKRTNIKAEDQSTLDELLSLSPSLGTLRAFVDDLHELFAIRRSKKQARRIWRRMRRNKSYLNNEHLCKALEVLKKENMDKLLVYLDSPSSIRSKVRTNNHVERCNRVLRYLEKVRYKWRRRRTIVRHILLQFANWMKRKENAAHAAA